MCIKVLVLAILTVCLAPTLPAFPVNGWGSLFVPFRQIDSCQGLGEKFQKIKTICDKALGSKFCRNVNLDGMPEEIEKVCDAENRELCESVLGFSAILDRDDFCDYINDLELPNDSPQHKNVLEEFFNAIFGTPIGNYPIPGPRNTIKPKLYPGPSITGFLPPPPFTPVTFPSNNEMQRGYHDNKLISRDPFPFLNTLSLQPKTFTTYQIEILKPDKKIPVLRTTSPLSFPPGYPFQDLTEYLSMKTDLPDADDTYHNQSFHDLPGFLTLEDLSDHEKSFNPKENKVSKLEKSSKLSNAHEVSKSEEGSKQNSMAISPGVKEMTLEKPPILSDSTQHEELFLPEDSGESIADWKKIHQYSSIPEGAYEKYDRKERHLAGLDDVDSIESDYEEYFYYQ